MTTERHPPGTASDATPSPPPGLILAKVPKAVLLLTVGEYAAGIRRDKWWRRTVAMQRRDRRSRP